MLPDTPVPSRSVNRCRNEGMPAMAKIPAAMERVPPTWGRRRIADIVEGQRRGNATGKRRRLAVLRGC
jgi:hypothetical protein